MLAALGHCELIKSTFMLEKTEQTNTNLLLYAVYYRYRWRNKPQFNCLQCHRCQYT